jgi:hypothetical protein
VQRQDKNSIVGFAYNGASFFPYKKLLVEHDKPDVITLGTSRVMQFRNVLFSTSTVFVNAGGAGKNVDDMALFIQTLQKPYPKIIILGLDKEVLGSVSRGEDHSSMYPPLRAATLAVSMGRRIYLDTLRGLIKYPQIHALSQESGNIGLQAIVHGDGFRRDGSYSYTSIHNSTERVAYVEQEVATRLHDLEENSPVLNESVVKNNLEKLHTILHECEEKGITVIGFMPPYPEPLYKNLASNSSYQDLSVKLEDIFSDHSAYLYNAEDITRYGGTPSEFVDGIHATDKMYAKIVLDLARAHSPLSGYVDTRYVERIIATSKDDFLDTLSR